jgi:hypothetical protein
MTEEKKADRQPAINATHYVHEHQYLADDVAAVRESLADMAAGDNGVPLDEFDREFRAKHGLPLPRSQS